MVATRDQRTFLELRCLLFATLDWKHPTNHPKNTEKNDGPPDPNRQTDDGRNFAGVMVSTTIR
jgi:hypothetical protein